MLARSSLVVARDPLLASGGPVSSTRVLLCLPRVPPCLPRLLLCLPWVPPCLARILLCLRRIRLILSHPTAVLDATAFDSLLVLVPVTAALLKVVGPAAPDWTGLVGSAPSFRALPPRSLTRVFGVAADPPPVGLLVCAGLRRPGDARVVSPGSIIAASRPVALVATAREDPLDPRLVLLAAPVRPEDAATVGAPVAPVLVVVPVDPLVLRHEIPGRSVGARGEKRRNRSRRFPAPSPMRAR